ncbi:hypothetical protein ACGFT2_15405 [Streptomyces sp. NPDC048514]|uniref:hypothetical protein n=1 Tax=Streptomyces sp. NPDC048514 TaxID=3365564 RepID=UPI0037216D60
MATKTEEGAEAGTEARTDETTAQADAAVQGRTSGTTGAETPEPATTDAEGRVAGDRDAEIADAGKAGAEPAADADAVPADMETAEEEAPEAREPEAGAASGIGQGAGAVVSAALGLVSLSGGWIGTVAGAREQLVGQLRTSSSASVATQLKEVYGDSWHTTALWAGLFALGALITGVVVLVRPAFGVPGRPQAAWTRSVAWAGVSLGVIGLLLAVLKYSDALLGLPSAG